MSKEREAILADITALEAQLDGKRPARQARRKSSGNNILAALGQLEEMVKEACGESFMDDVDTEAILEALPDEEVPGEDMDEMGYMDDESACGYMDDASMMAADEPAAQPAVEDGAEDEIDQDYLDDALETQKNPASVVTDQSMLDAAPTEYVARLKSASARLDRVAAYCEQQGRTKLAFRIDQIADAIDARINEMEAHDA